MTRLTTELKRLACALPQRSTFNASNRDALPASPGPPDHPAGACSLASQGFGRSRRPSQARVRFRLLLGLLILGLLAFGAAEVAGEGDDDEAPLPIAPLRSAPTPGS
jgi:hypothetical protein